MTNFEFQKLEKKLQHTQRVLAKLQAEYRKVTGKDYLLGQGITRLHSCAECAFAVNNGQIICCNEDAIYFDTVVSEGCSLFESI